MAEKGRREVVGDPLANNAFAQMPDRSLSTIGARNPGQTSGAPSDPGFDALGQFGSVLSGILDEKKDDWIAEGKVRFMQGATEEEINRTGNKYTVQGWQSLSVADRAARWFTDESLAINDKNFSQSPEEYSSGLMKRRAEFFKDLPSDPAIRKLYVAAFDDYGPRLAADQAAKHNAYNTQRTEDSFSDALKSGAKSAADATRVMPGSAPLRLSPGIVRQSVAYNDADVDALALTMLGEAGGEGPTGMAAVAHVVVNRAIDGGYGGKSISAVVKSPKQFSTWNAGPGGNNPERYAHSAAFNTAREIAKNVLSGHHIDPTNGATHYYSPDGMAALVRGGSQTNLVPKWWGDKEAATGSITIGGHKFAGRARGLTGRTPVTTNGATMGGIRFQHSGQEGIDEGFAGILRDSSNDLGRELVITSGYRSAEYNASVGGAAGSRHVHKDAVDIDMKGMDNNQRAALVQTLRARGVKRFGAYSKHKDMLHVDMSQDNGENWFMYDKSNDNMGNAPEWFKQVASSPIPPIDTAVASSGGREATEVNGDAGDSIQVAEASGIATSETPSGPQSQVQELVRSFGNIPPARRGLLLAQAMVDQMALEDDQLYNDAGGEQFLREMGAPEDAIQKVTLAHQQFRDKKLNGWNADNLKWQNNLVTSVGSGELSADEAISQIDARVSGQRMTEEHAQSLGQAVLNAAAQVGKQAVTDPKAMRAVTEIYRGVVNGVFTPEDADAKIRDLAKVYDMPETQVKNLIGQMWSTEQSSILQSKNAVEAAAKKKAEQDERKALVDQAIANGTGLDALSGAGTIEAFDPSVNATRSMSAEQYGVEKIKQNAAAGLTQRAHELVRNGLDPDEAQDKANAEAEKSVYMQLKRQNVVDAAGARKIRGGLIGEIIENVGGKLQASNAAQEALDFYVRMAEDPAVGEEYMAKMLDDPGARMLVTTARTLMAGRYDVNDALVRAHQLMSDPNVDVNRRISEEGMFTARVDMAVDDIIKDKIGTGFFSAFADPSGSHMFNQEDISDLKRNTAPINSEIKRRAQAYFMQNPRITMEVAVKMASEDAKNDATIAGTSVVFGDNTKGERLDQVMGLTKFGPRAVTDAIDYYLENAGERVFGDLWKNNAPNMVREYGFRVADTMLYGQLSGEGFNMRPFAKIRNTPRYEVFYNTNSADPVIGIQLRDKADIPVGPIQWIDAKQLGETYMDETDAREPSWVSKTIGAGVEGAAEIVEGMPDSTPRPGTPADWLNKLTGGRMVKQ